MFYYGKNDFSAWQKVNKSEKLEINKKLSENIRYHWF